MLSRGTETPYDYCLSLKKNSQSYAGFNIIVGHLDNCCVFSNREIFQAPIELMKKEVCISCHKRVYIDILH